MRAGSTPARRETVDRAWETKGTRDPEWMWGYPEASRREERKAAGAREDASV